MYLKFLQKISAEHTIRACVPEKKQVWVISQCICQTEAGIDGFDFFRGLSGTICSP